MRAVSSCSTAATTRVVAVVVVVVFVAAPALARGSSCKDDPDLVGPCFAFRGELFVANGTPSARILRFGTRRILGVSERHRAYMPQALESRLTFDDRVRGDFTVCPFSPSEPGKMQLVCIESASRMILERRVDGNSTTSKIPMPAGHRQRDARRTSRYTGPGLALLASAGERSVTPTRNRGGRAR